MSKTTSCLESHRVIVNPLPAKENPVPRRFRGIGVLAISFALVHGQELDAATLTFEKDPATARRVLVAFKAWALELAKQLKDTAAPTLLPKLLGVIGNVIVFWDDPSVKSASRRTLANCLRS